MDQGESFIDRQGRDRITSLGQSVSAIHCKLVGARLTDRLLTATVFYRVMESAFLPERIASC